MSDKRKQQLMEMLNKCYKIVKQSSANGISAIEVADKLEAHRTTAHSYLNTLELMGKVFNEHGLWKAVESQRKPPTMDIFSGIKTETDKIKEDYVRGDFVLAERRLLILVNTRLDFLSPQSDIGKEMRSLIAEYNQGIEKARNHPYARFDPNIRRRLLLSVAENMIPKFLIVFAKMEKEGVES